MSKNQITPSLRSLGVPASQIFARIVSASSLFVLSSVFFLAIALIIKATSALMLPLVEFISLEMSSLKRLIFPSQNCIAMQELDVALRYPCFLPISLILLGRNT